MAHSTRSGNGISTGRPIGKPLPQERTWRFVTVDATETKDKLEEFTDRRFRDITLPTAMKNWYMPDFDDSQWTSGKAPIGKRRVETQRHHVGQVFFNVGQRRIPAHALHV